MANFQIVEEPEHATAALRERVPAAELTGFFSRAFRETMSALKEQNLRPTGPPFGKYYGSPNEVIDVEAGFPIAEPITPDADVVLGILPGGRSVEAIHIGPYDTIGDTYAEIERYFADAKLTPGAVMWESYLTDPATESDPSKWRTRICWPIVEAMGSRPRR
ncbi:GyrI-like domain-containing protein [Microbacterium profundi]|uniref:GyrI-like domain-containing protein n=1 Tax=Microbacterium profundi TaxID=450380 RepID=UPI0019D12834|nr:GyrI-like domain-containing protein [Microbacterium profundi]MCE7481812.1 GyrI-like domain-containing protein [Microbacterium profundi]